MCACEWHRYRGIGRLLHMFSAHKLIGIFMILHHTHTHTSSFLLNIWGLQQLIDVAKEIDDKVSGRRIESWVISWLGHRAGLFCFFSELKEVSFVRRWWQKLLWSEPSLFYHISDSHAWVTKTWRNSGSRCSVIAYQNFQSQGAMHACDHLNKNSWEVY